MAPYKILKQGYIMKEPPASKRGLRRKLHRYWFVLVEDPQQVALVYFKSEDAYITRQRNEGFIRVDNSISINVISEHLGCKNAFVIKSIRNDYTLVPESRYDLHEWLFILHNSIEAFKTKQRKAEERRRLPLRLRANTVDSITVPAQPPSETGSLRTRTPTRRAPPAPPTAATGGRTGSTGRRKPVRPAPAAPGTRRGRSQSHSQPMSPMSSVTSSQIAPSDVALETPPPAYSDASSGTPVHSLTRNGRSPGMFDMSVHPVMDLNISNSEQDELHRELSLPRREEPSRSVRPHSASDTLLLMHQNSASLPDLMSCEGNIGTNLGVAVGGVASEEGGAIRLRSVSESRHTRHLSLIGNEDIHAKRQPRDKKKRAARRNGSIKLRSRSPPNMPPPPPPPMGELHEDSEEPTISEVHQRSHMTDLAPPPVHNGVGGDLTSQSSSVSVGFSEVMNTISNIDHELDGIGISPIKPSIPVPKRTTGLMAQGGAEFTVGEEDFNEEEWLCDGPDETTPLSPNRPTPEGGPQSAEEDSEAEAAVRESRKDGFVPADQLVSSGFIPASAIDSTTSDFPGKSAKGKHRVMFKEEVEDIPNNYEPRVDHEEHEEEEIPTGVAALKKKLFGDKEKQTTRYKKEGVLSPKFVHPTNMTFEAGYQFDEESTPFFHEASPNVNNNNGSDGEQATLRLTEQQQGEENVAGAMAVVEDAVPIVPPVEKKSPWKQEGLYDPPWEHSSVSKFKVIGRIRSGSAGNVSKPGKERTPPPISPKSKKGIQFGEVSIKDTPTPGSTEIRNVHSLERTKLRKERIVHQEPPRSLNHHEPPMTSPGHTQPLDRPGYKGPSPPHATTSPQTLTSPTAADKTEDDDLLASITDTLQRQSKYGSITLLSPPTSSLDQSVGGGVKEEPKKIPAEVRRSSRGELEKIRAAHRREPPPPPVGVATLVTTPTRSSSQGSPPGHHVSPQRMTAGTRTSPQGTVNITRQSPQGPSMVPAAMRSSPPNQNGPTMAQPMMGFPQQMRSPLHSSPKSAPHHSSQILTSPAHRSGQAKRRMFSGRPRMAASLDELQTDPMIQVTYDANSKSHIFRSLV